MTYRDISRYECQMDLKRDMLATCESFCERTGKKPSTVGTYAVNDGKFFDRLGGDAKFQFDTYQRVMQWFSDHWPSDAAWPEGIHRPAPNLVASAEDAA